MKSIHQRWVEGDILDKDMEGVYLEGVYGEITYYENGLEITHWLSGDTIRSKQWYKENYYDKIKN